MRTGLGTLLARSTDQSLCSMKYRRRGTSYLQVANELSVGRMPKVLVDSLQRCSDDRVDLPFAATGSALLPAWCPATGSAPLPATKGLSGICLLASFSFIIGSNHGIGKGSGVDA